jgi:Flp pilus assembly protein TadG
MARPRFPRNLTGASALTHSHGSRASAPADSSASILPNSGRCLRLDRCACQGTALIEFALVFPLMIVIFLGLVEFGEAFAVNRKLTNSAGTVSDLVAQVPRVNTAELNDIARVAEEIVKPYRTVNLGLVVSSIRADGNNAPTVAWSYAHGTGATARAQGSAVTLPSGVTEPNSSVILAETTYQFTPTVGMFLTGAIELSGQAYFRPRVSRTVAFED